MKKLFLLLACILFPLAAFAEDILKFGSTSVKLQMTFKDATTGALKTGITSSTSGLILSVRADNAASPTLYTVAATHIQTIATLGTYAAPSASNIRFQEVDATNQPGVYEVQAADALFSTSGARTLTFDGVGTGVTADPLRVVLTDASPSVACSSISNGSISNSTFASGAIDATAFAQGAADKVWSTTTRQLTGTQTFNVTGNVTGNVSGSVGSVTGAVGSISGVTFPTNFSAMVISSGGVVNGNVIQWNSSNVSTPDTAGQPKVTIASGTSTGQLSLTSGVVAASIGTNGIGAASVAQAAANKIADSVWRRNSSNIEASSDGDTLNFQSPYGVVAQQTNPVVVSSGVLTVKKADGATTFVTRSVTSAAGAAPITGLN